MFLSYLFVKVNCPVTGTLNSKPQKLKVSKLDESQSYQTLISTYRNNRQVRISSVKKDPISIGCIPTTSRTISSFSLVLNFAIFSYFDSAA